jgi:hypothetical protein
MTRDDNDKIKSAEEAVATKAKVDQLDRSLGHLIATSNQVASSNGNKRDIMDIKEALQRDRPPGDPGSKSAPG